MKSLASFPAFFYALLYDMVLDRARYDFLRTCGIRAKDWPECEAKNIALEFDSRVKAKGFDYASSVVFNQSLKTSPEIEIPRETNNLVAQYEDHKAYGLYTQLAKSLLSDPLSGVKTLSAFKDRNSSSVSIVTLKDALAETIPQIEAGVKAGTSVIQIPQWPILSDLVGGFNPDRVFIFTARTGVGKTSLALNLAIRAIETMPVLYFNMEMSIRDISTRCLQIGSKISSQVIRSGEYIQHQNKLEGFVSLISGANELFISDGRSLSLEQISTEIIRRREEQGIGLVVVDYDQKIRSASQDEEWKALHRAMEELEDVSKAAHVPIIVLAQANDDGNPRASQRTTQVASAVIHLDEVDGKFLLNAKKNRYGARDAKIEISFDKSTQSMTEVGLFQDKHSAMSEVARRMKGPYGPAIF